MLTKATQSLFWPKLARISSTPRHTARTACCRPTQLFQPRPQKTLTSHSVTSTWASSKWRPTTLPSLIDILTGSQCFAWTKTTRSTSSRYSAVTSPGGAPPKKSPPMEPVRSALRPLIHSSAAGESPTEYPWPTTPGQKNRASSQDSQKARHRQLGTPRHPRHRPVRPSPPGAPHHF